MMSTSLYALLLLAAALSVAVAASYPAVRAIKSHSKTWMKDATSSISGSVRRRRQASVMTAAEIKEALDHHNALRTGEGADNMELMVCNNNNNSFYKPWKYRRYL